MATTSKYGVPPSGSGLSPSVFGLPGLALPALADAAACADHSLRGEHLNEVVIRAASDSGIEVDDLDLGERGEALQHAFGRVAFEGLFAALNQLDHFAVHQVYAG